MKLGLIAGGGDLPKHVAYAAGEELGQVIVLDGFGHPDDFPNAAVIGLAQFGKIVKTLKKSGCTHVCFVGYVDRPNFKNMKPDLRALFLMPGAMKAATNGDDALLRHILGLFEKEGFEIISPQEVCVDLLLQEGALGAVNLPRAHREDALSACHIAQVIGGLDIGQGAVVARGVTLAVEAQEGTDAMLRRVASLPQDLRGTAGERVGVLAKMVKPRQDQRVDLPVIGLATVENAAAAGLAGIVAEAGRAFVLDEESVVEAANKHGIFVLGLPPSEND